jgi:hypothetical protein
MLASAVAAASPILGRDVGAARPACALASKRLGARAPIHPPLRRRRHDLPVHETLFTVVAPGREHCSMSWVANLMVQADRADAALVQRLDEWLQAAPRRDGTFGPRGVGSLRSLTNPLDHTWGGWKNPECDLWAGALNHADLEALLDCIRSLPWRHAGRLQVFLMDQEESYFRLYMFRDGRLQQFAPPPPPDADDQHAW